MIEQGVLANRARILGHVVGYFPWHARVTGQMNLEGCGKRPGRIRRGFDHDCVQAVARHGPLQGLDSLVFSPDSSRYAYGGTQNQPGPIFLDGKDTGLTGNFTFSPDSKHITVVGFRSSDHKRGVFVDGQFV